MNLAEIAIQRRVVTLVSTALLVLGGAQAYQELGRLEDPEFTIKNAQVFTRYPGATPQQVAEEVTEGDLKAADDLRNVEFFPERQLGPADNFHCCSHGNTTSS